MYLYLLMNTKQYSNIKFKPIKLNIEFYYMSTILKCLLSFILNKQYKILI